MKQRLLGIFILSLFLLTPLEVAASDCKFYADQFQRLLSANSLNDTSTDQAIVRVGQAKEFFNQGVALCASGQDADGAAALQQAIQVIGSD